MKNYCRRSYAKDYTPQFLIGSKVNLEIQKIAEFYRLSRSQVVESALIFEILGEKDGARLLRQKKKKIQGKKIKLKQATKVCEKQSQNLQTLF